MRDLVVTLIVMGSLPLILLEPYVGVLMWAWLGLMNPHRLTWGFAQNFPFAEIVAITTLIALLVSQERKRIPWTREVALFTAMCAWMIVTTIFSLFPILAYPFLSEVLKIALMTYVSIMLINDKKRLNQFVGVIVFSLGFYGVKGGIFTIMTGGHFHVQGPPGTFIGGNNELGLAMVMTLPLVRYLHLQTTNRRLRGVLVATMALTVIAILGTQSRGAFLGITAMGLFLIAKSRKRLTLLLAIAVVVPTALLLMPHAWYARMGTIRTYQQNQSAEGRIQAWEFAMAEAAKRPILGGGFGLNKGSHKRAAHSIYFQTLGEQGFPGLVLFLALGLTVWRAGSKVIVQVRERKDLRWLSDLAAMNQVSLVGYSVSGAFLSLAYFDLYYYIIALMVICKVLAARLLETAPEGELARPAVPASKAWWVPASSAAARYDEVPRVSDREPGTNARGPSEPRS